MNPRLRSRVTRFDLAALLVFLAVWVYYVVTVRYGVSFSDEGFYLAVAQRFAHGERPLVDEWHLGQLSFVFLCLPYKLYVALKGGTDGIILFMRYLFVAFNAAAYWFIYIRLRPFKRQGLFATALFCIYVPFGIYACNYYTVPIRLLMIVCLLLFDEKKKMLPMLTAGVLFACSVLYQPGFAFLYFGFSVLVWIRFLRQKKGRRFLESFDFCLQIRTWALVSLGALLCAVVFLIWLISRSGLRNILTSVPYLLLTDPEYDYSAGGNAWSIFFRKLAEIGRFYGGALLISALAIVVLSIVFARGVFRARRKEARNALFVLACALWIISCAQTLRILKDPISDVIFAAYPAPLFWFGFVCFLLSAQKNKRVLFFWVVGLACSLCVDCFSDVTFAIGCPIAYISVFVFIADLVREMHADFNAQRLQKRSGAADRKKAAAERIAVRACAYLACGCMTVFGLFALLCLQNTSFTAYEISGVPLTCDTVSCEGGPCQSLRYPKAYEQNYRDKMADVDSIKSRRPKNLYICNISPEMYLYADLPCAAFSSYSLGETRFLNRQVLYWKLHPEKRPACIFVPFDKVETSPASAESLLSWVRESFDPLCTYTLENGKSGYILYVSQWYPEAAQ